MAEDRQTIIQYLKNKNSPFGAHTWESAGGLVKVQWLPDEGKGFIDIQNIEGVKGASGFRQILRQTLPKLDVLGDIPTKWEFNPDNFKKGRIYQMLGPKLKGAVTANPDMPNQASIWNTTPKAKGTIMGVKKRTTNPQITEEELEQFRKTMRAELAEITDRNIARAHKEIPGFTERLAAKKLTREDSKFLRTDIRRNILGPGNVELVSTNVSQYAQGKANLPGLSSKAAQVKGKLKRDTSKQLQTDRRIKENILTKEFIDEAVADKLKYWDNPSEALLQAHHIRMINMYEPFFEGLSEYDQKRLTQFATDAKYPLGDAKANIALLDRDFHTALHNYMKAEGFQLYGGKVTTKHGIPPLGNTFESRKAALGVFFTNVQDPIEKKMFSLQWDQHAKYKPMTHGEMQEALEWINDDEVRKAQRALLAGDGDINKVKYGSGPEPAILQRMGRIAKVTTGLSSAESALRLASGDVVGGTMGLLMNTPTFQKEAGKLLLKQGIKFIPGVSLGSGALQAIGYMSGGQWQKAGLSMLGGVVGELPGGDAVQAAIDLGLTGHDIATEKRNMRMLANNAEIPEVEGTEYMRRLEGAKSLDSAKAFRSIARNIP